VAPVDETAAAPIVVVTGVPRSGTSLAMQMLAAGGLPVLCDGARPPDPDNPRGYYELAAVRRTAADPAWVERAPGRAVKVVHALVPALPRDRSYRVILVRRDLREVVASQEAMLRRRGEPPPGPTPARLVEIYAAQLDALVAWLRGTPGVAWLEVEHAGLLASPRTEAARLDRFLGGGLDRDAMADAVDPRLYRQRAGPGEGAGLGEGSGAGRG